MDERSGGNGEPVGGSGAGGAAGAAPADRASPGAAIRVRDLTRRFGDFVAVDRLRFTVGEGEIFGFLGPNGAGKTTTIKMLTGLLRPSGGRAEVAGLDVERDSLRLRSRIGYMSQLFSLYPDLRVEENIRLYAGLYGVRGERLAARREWILRMAGLGDHRERPTAELPLGFKQRLALGCAVLHEPRILFLDEPTSGVDPVARRDFWDLIYGFAEAGTTVLVSTHYMEEAEYCDRLALMNRGRLVALDTPAGLRAGLDAPLWEVSVDDPPAAVEALRDLPGVAEASMYGRTVRVLAEAEEVSGEEAIRRRLEEAGCAATDVRTGRPSLEDVFVALVRREGGARAG